MLSIDLNADLGEYSNQAGQQFEAEIFPYITTCNIACGGHAGDDASMMHTIALAKKNQVTIGAHPAFPDREGFGRRRHNISDDALKASITEQISALIKIAEMHGAHISHVKPHGALYNIATQDTHLANMIALVTQTFGQSLALFGPPKSALQEAAKQHGLAFIAEGFVDRAYEQNGTLVSRSLPGAIIETQAARVKQALTIAQVKKVTLINGSEISLSVNTLCLHGDDAEAVETAKQVRRALDKAGINVVSYSNGAV